MNVMDYLTMFGAATGLISISIAAYRLWQEKAKINLTLSCIDGKTNSSFFPVIAIRDDFPSKPYRICIQVQITNKCRLPTTVYEVQAVIDNIGKFHFTEYIHAPNYYPIPISLLKTLKIPVGESQIKLPLRLEPYEFKRGYIFFPVNKDLLEDTYTVKLTTLSSRGEFTHAPISISRIDLELNSGNNRDKDSA